MLIALVAPASAGGNTVGHSTAKQAAQSDDKGEMIAGLTPQEDGLPVHQSPITSPATPVPVAAPGASPEGPENLGEGEGASSVHTYAPAGEQLAGTVIAPTPAALAVDAALQATDSGLYWLLLAAATLTLASFAFATLRLRLEAVAGTSGLRDVVGHTAAFARQLWDGRKHMAEPDADRTSFAALRADLHDGPAQHLAYALMHLDDIEPRDAPAGDHRREAFKKVEAALKAALEEIREIASGTSLPAVRRLDPASVITSAIRNHEVMTHTSVEHQISGLPPALAPSVKVCLYRFTQEGLNNAYRHARGKGQKLTIKLAGNEILAEVADEGPGAADAPAKSDRLGLAGLRQRAEAAGGKLELVSEPGRGTKLVLRLPAAKRADVE